MKIGYARVSTLDQNLDLQINALCSAECELIFQEKASGTRTDRPKLNKLLEQLRAGEQIVVWKLDRLGRSLAHLVELVNQWEKQGVGLVSLNDPVDTTTAQGRLIFSIFASLAEYERALMLIRERTIAGLATTKLQGRMGVKRWG